MRIELRRFVTRARKCKQIDQHVFEGLSGRTILRSHTDSRSANSWPEEEGGRAAKQGVAVS